MRPEQSEAELRKRIPDPNALTAAAAMRAMLDFYRDVRAEGCPVEEDGDMLLYQWGDYGKGFEWNLTRQFISEESEDDDAITQLSLTLKFGQFGTVGSGNEWCATPDDVDAYEACILASPAFMTVKDETPTSVEIDYGGV